MRGLSMHAALSIVRHKSCNIPGSYYNSHILHGLLLCGVLNGGEGDPDFLLDNPFKAYPYLLHYGNIPEASLSVHVCYVAFSLSCSLSYMFYIIQLHVFIVSDTSCCPNGTTSRCSTEKSLVWRENFLWLLSIQFGSQVREQSPENTKEGLWRWGR